VPFREDKLVLICHPQHALSKLGEVDIRQLSGHKFVGFDPDIPTRKAVDMIFRENKLEIDPVMEFDNVETVKRAVEIDAGLAVVPQATVAQEVKQGTLVELSFKNRTFTRPLALLHRKGRVLTPAMRKFIEVITLDAPKNFSRNAASIED
jgi:DNA-binding transcriptional LysR family regulator